MSMYKNKKLINKLTDKVLEIEGVDWKEGETKNLYPFDMRRMKPSSQKIKGLLSEKTYYNDIKKDDREYMVVFGFTRLFSFDSQKWDTIEKDFPFLIKRTEEGGLEMKSKKYTFDDKEVTLQIWNELTNKRIDCYGVLCSFNVWGKSDEEIN